MNEFGSNVERHRDSLKEGAPLRPWLYGVATNACLDAIARDERRAVLVAKAEADDGWAGQPDDVVWLGPIPDSVLEPPTLNFRIATQDLALGRAAGA